MYSESEILIKIGIQLRKLRESKNLSQQNLADISDMPKSTIARIERAEVSVKFTTLVKIATAIEMDLKVFFDFLISEK